MHFLPVSQGCALLILESNGQRSMSSCIDDWKWFLDRKRLSNPSTHCPWVKVVPHWFGGQKVKCGISTKSGDIKTHLSLLLSVCHKNFNLAHTFWSIHDRALILGMHDPCDKPFQLTPCRDLDLWPTSRSELLPGRGLQFSEFACYIFDSPVLAIWKVLVWSCRYLGVCSWRHSNGVKFTSLSFLFRDPY